MKALEGVLPRRPPLLEEYDDFMQIRSLIDEAIQSVQSQNLAGGRPLSVQQRIEGYDALLLEYDNTQARLREYDDTAADLLYDGSIGHVNRLLNALEHEVRGSMATLLRERERTPGRKRARAGRWQTLDPEIARTATWWGRPVVLPRRWTRVLSMSSTQSIRSLVASFRQTPGSEAFETLTETSTAPVRAARPLEKLLGDARKPLERQAIVLDQARNEALQASPPASVEASCRATARR